MDVTFMRRATAPVAISGTAEDEDEGEEEKGGPAAGRRAPRRRRKKTWGNTQVGRGASFE